MIKIGIDVRRFISPESGIGLYQYAYQLIKAIEKINSDNKYLLFFCCFRKQHRDIINRLNFKDNFYKKNLFLPYRISELLLKNKLIPIEAFMGIVDIFHGTYFDLQLQFQGRSIVTIHDLMFLRYPEFLKEEWVGTLKKQVAYSIKHADAIIAVSEFTKGELIDCYKLNGNKIHVIHNGKDDRFIPVHDRESLECTKKRYGIDGNYILFVGNVEPKKNIERLVRAYNALSPNIKNAYILVIAGPQGWYFKELVKNLGSNLLDKVIFTGVIADADLPALYSGAELFAFPSLHEGFGMPPLEAMACGTPVLVSNSSSLPEVVGDAAVMVNPFNVDEIAEGINNIIQDQMLKRDIVHKAIRRAKMFSWEKTAKDTVALYKSLCI